MNYFLPGEMTMKNVLNITFVFNYRPLILNITLKSPQSVGQGNVSIQISNNISKVVFLLKPLDEHGSSKTSESEVSNGSYEVALLNIVNVH